jgi:hypothetical protein
MREIPMKTLKLALIHANIRHKEPDSNRTVLIDLIRQAAQQGANIVVTPEMAISGYSFSSRTDILPYTEIENGPTLSRLAEVVKETGIYVCIGLAEKDACTGIFYNSAFVMGPDGQRLCRYRKINAESRWACPGDPKEDNTFETPWGRVGVLISCSFLPIVSMPSATTFICSVFAKAMIATSNRSPFSPSPIADINPLSIFRTLMGNSLRWSRDEYPVPKSSKDKVTPCSTIDESIAAVALVSEINTLSVISSSRLLGSSSYSAKTFFIASDRVFCLI